MRKTVDKLYNKVGIKSDRTKNITKHVLLSFVYKGGSILSSFLLVPLTINYLDTENYGIWLTLSSFIAWFSFFDIGLGNGLRNKFAEAKAKGDMTLARGYVSSAYFTIGAVSLGLIVIFTALNFFIDWTKVFNASPGLQKDLSILMPIVFGFFCLQLVVKLITTIYTADQHHSMQGKINFFIQLGSLASILILTKTSKGSLLYFGILYSLLPVLILIGFNIVGFKKRFLHFKPSFRFWKMEFLTDIFGLGITFFLIQISGIILFTSDNLIITQLFGPEEVVPYNIAYKYFSIVVMAFSIILTPYWSSITEAYTVGDITWIKKSMKILIKLTFVGVTGVILLLTLSPIAYEIWIGHEINIPISLSISMSSFIILSLIYTPFTVFINGTGKVTLQMLSIFLTSIVNIPLSILLAKHFELGSTGVIIATIICLIPHALLCPIQYHKIINNKANGIWNR
ncbi:MAG: polysaccharide biosynthesis protein [Bacteroidetes bacterium]|nr:MAG: polysaccharide biosynthesis protein [Bacteroidota bacterium]